MKVNAALLSAFALGATAIPTSQILEKRVAAPVNTGGINLIESLEGFKPNFYTINGHKTIGFGHDCVERGGCDSLHPPITKAQGTTLLKSDITEYETCVCALPNAANLNANQYGALVSFTYNSGCGGVSKYFRSDMQSSNFAGICSSLPTTNTLGGELSSRRQKEGAFCSQASNQKSGCGGATGPAPTKTKAAEAAKRTP
ncbi:hypothetical protein MMC10_002790 [Thelotrema lepadinum]|nr:hypothetical protein [Thelotrema lepadinum]